MKIPIRPFYTPSFELVEHHGWLIDSGGELVPLPEEFDRWDYKTTLELSGSLTIRRGSLVKECHLETDSSLAVLVSVHSSRTRTERRVELIDVPVADDLLVTAKFCLVGDELGGTLAIRTYLVATNPIPTDDLAASRPGSILWQEEHRTRLEGIGSMFPTYAVDFSSTNRRSGAGWRLRVDTSRPDALFNGAVYLELNSGMPAVMKVMQGATDKDSIRLAKVMKWDVTRQLVLQGLASDDVIYSEIDPEGIDVASVLRLVLGNVWPGVAPAVIRTWLLDNPSKIEIDLQESCGVVL